jgi:hypothetical protein
MSTMVPRTLMLAIPAGPRLSVVCPETRSIPGSGPGSCPASPKSNQVPRALIVLPSALNLPGPEMLSFNVSPVDTFVTSTFSTPVTRVTPLLKV